MGGTRRWPTGGELAAAAVGPGRAGPGELHASGGSVAGGVEVALVRIERGAGGRQPASGGARTPDRLAELADAGGEIKRDAGRSPASGRRRAWPRRRCWPSLDMPTPSDVLVEDLGLAGGGDRDTQAFAAVDLTNCADGDA